MHVTQSLGNVRWAFKTSRSFRLIDMTAGSAARTACLLIGPKGAPKKESKLCLTGTSLKAHALYRSAVNPGGPKAGFVSGTITRLNKQQLTVSFAASSIGLVAPVKADFQVSTVWRGTTACPTATPCRDQAPTHGYAAWRFDRYHATGCVPKGTSYRFFGPSGNHAMALTFDDGPSAYTSAVLATLQRYGVHATFFEVGDEVVGRPAASRAIIAAGDAIGDHTWSHPILTGSNTQSQMAQGRAAIINATGYTPCLARVPYGIAPASTVNTIRNMGMLTIQWDIDPRDWSLPGAGSDRPERAAKRPQRRDRDHARRRRQPVGDGRGAQHHHPDAARPRLQAGHRAAAARPRHGVHVQHQLARYSAPTRAWRNW